MAGSASFILPVFYRFSIGFLRELLPSRLVGRRFFGASIRMNRCAHLRKRLAPSLSRPPGTELTGLILLIEAMSSFLVADVRHDDLVNEHVVAVFDVVKMDLRIFSDLRSLDHFSI